ncbi:16S rRNA (cytosine(967)-C(5))-methyltransferase RsmB [Acidicapsa ligni]|uniref:16S rRNA (cytosine(967)-C(5))-methyltransferase RsmB n=1 Tax=Acidicapsa ligni TaxID=542300 RepID=UPI0021E0F194|nr:16S rRNA (cytosine(967)-C(5))-methyltransferase RsmB [Acidicapsa ligni]
MMTAKSSSDPALKLTIKPKSVAISPARREAFAILLELERGHSYADDLLRGQRVTALSQQDRNLCTTLVLGVLRWQIRLDSAIHPLLARPNARLDPEIRIALRLGGFQLLFLDRIPAHAAIGESVGLAKAAGHKFASGMVNAILRKLTVVAKPSVDVPEHLSPVELAEASGHPVWLVERWVSFYGSETARAICLHGQQQPIVALRLDSVTAEDELAAEGIRVEAGALLTAARVVAAGDVTASVAFREGRVRIQEEGSQLIAELAGSGSQILDCCAAPGGKTLILAANNPTARVVASEASAARLSAMQRRLSSTANQASIRRIEFRQADAAVRQDGDAFDLVLVDVPCSGTGTLGRNPEIRHRLQPADLERHHKQQCAILRAALQSTIVGGRLVYSTCSLEPEENEAVVAEVLIEAGNWKWVSFAARIRELQTEGRLTDSGVEHLLQCVGNDGALRLLPGKLATDGFFVVLLERVS